MLDNINNNNLDLNINSEIENANYEDNDDEPIDDIQIEGARFIENVDLLENIETTTKHQNDSSTNTPYAKEYDEEQTSTSPPISEEETLTRDIEDDKENDDMHNNHQNIENRNRPEKEITEKEDGNEDEEVDIYNDISLRDRVRVENNKLHNYGRTQMITINKQPSTSSIYTFRKVSVMTFNTLVKMNMSNR